MRVGVVFSLLFFLALGVHGQDSLCIDLMRPEAKVVGIYLPIKDFHHGLMFECREPGKAPYMALDGIHNAMQDAHNKIITMREEGCQMIDSLNTIDPVQASLYHREQFDKMSSFSEIYVQYGLTYDSLCAAHDIQMISHRLYGDSLMVRLLAWQDTLVNQGVQISKCNQALKASGLESRSDEYRSRYQPISQMQLIHKEFQAKLMQVENQQSRYASSRQDEVFYLGPYLVERHDVMSSEGFFDDLRDMQGRFQNHREAFYRDL